MLVRVQQSDRFEFPIPIPPDNLTKGLYTRENKVRLLVPYSQLIHLADIYIHYQCVGNHARAAASKLGGISNVVSSIVYPSHPSAFAVYVWREHMNTWMKSTNQYSSDGAYRVAEYQHSLFTGNIQRFFSKNTFFSPSRGACGSRRDGWRNIHSFHSLRCKKEKRYVNWIKHAFFFSMSSHPFKLHFFSRIYIFRNNQINIVINSSCAVPESFQKAA